MDCGSRGLSSGPTEFRGAWGITRGQLGEWVIQKSLHGRSNPTHHVATNSDPVGGYFSGLRTSRVCDATPWSSLRNSSNLLSWTRCLPKVKRRRVDVRKATDPGRGVCEAIAPRLVEANGGHLHEAVGALRECLHWAEDQSPCRGKASGKESGEEGSRQCQWPRERERAPPAHDLIIPLRLLLLLSCMTSTPT